MDENIRPIKPDDILLWPDGTWCYRHDLHEMGHKSDDYEVIPFGSLRYLTFDEVMS